MSAGTPHGPHWVEKLHGPRIGMPPRPPGVRCVDNSRVRHSSMHWFQIQPVFVAETACYARRATNMVVDLPRRDRFTLNVRADTKLDLLGESRIKAIP